MDLAVLEQAARWLADGRQVALATVLSTWGSAPRRPGAQLAVADDGRFEGSVSGGCVEGDVILAAEEVMRTGQPQTLRFGVDQATAWSAGLACGGTIEIFVEPVSPAPSRP